MSLQTDENGNTGKVHSTASTREVAGSWKTIKPNKSPGSDGLTHEFKPQGIGSIGW